MVQQGTKINIVNEFSETPRQLQPWHGAAKLVTKWQEEDTIEKYSISKEEYEEHGSEYFKEHMLSNLHYSKR